MNPPAWVYGVPWLTVRQPWADLIMAGVKDVENRTWQPPSTLPQWGRCPLCSARVEPGCWKPGDLCFGDSTVGMGHVGRPAVADGPFPFWLGIHAAAKPDSSAAASEARASVDWQTADQEGPEPRGALLGSVEVTGCHHAHECRDAGGCNCGAGGVYGHEPRCGEQQPCSRWAEPDVFHWQVHDPLPLDVPVPWKGRQGLWRITGEVPV
jgi:hypothetical protein